jgi:molecular chaperone GrpE
MKTTSWRERFIAWLGFTPTTQSLAEVQSKLNAITQTQLETRTALENLDKQVARTGQEQNKANALTETQLKTLSAALERLRDLESHRDHELGALRSELDTAQSEGRRQIVKAFLPILDGLEEALATAPKAESVQAWLQGLVLLRAQLLDLLAAEEIYPIKAVGQSFDPQWHVAVETVPITADQTTGLIVRELRRGYVQGTIVLRYAEVVVAR